MKVWRCPKENNGSVAKIKVITANNNNDDLVCENVLKCPTASL